MFDPPILHNVFPENYTKTIHTFISVLLHSRNSTDNNMCYGVVIIYDKDLLYKVGNAIEQ